MSSLENIIESLYFSASRPISESEIVKILNDSNYDLKAVKNAISILVLSVSDMVEISNSWVRFRFSAIGAPLYKKILII